MKAKTCRDCGNTLEQSARGCPRCALNFEAENMIDGFVWRVFVPGVFVVVLALMAAVYYFKN